jgi:YcaO-like protein with predicted kinase domain
LKVVSQGTHRVCRFADSWAQIRSRFGEMGITRVANVTGLDDIGVPVVMACRPMARTISVFQGKGLTLEAARVSGAMEAIECFHAEEELELSIRTASWAELASHAPAVDLAALPLRRGAVLDVRRSMRWIEGRDLLSGSVCWVPEACVRVMQNGQLASTSRGLASGNTLCEALSHGVCEVIEHHSLAVWQALPGELRRATRIDLATVDDDGCRWVLDRFERAQLDVGAFNMTGESGIAALAAYVAPRTVDGHRLLPPAAGFGCHPDRRVALARALTEAAQSRLTHIAGARDDMTPGQYSEGTRAEFVAHVRAFIRGGGARPFDTLPTVVNSRVSEDLAWELDRLRAGGIEQVAGFDLTRSDIGIPVVRVVIPGLRSSGWPSAEMTVR